MKSNFRFRSIDHITDLMKISYTILTPNIKKLVKTKNIIFHIKLYVTILTKIVQIVFFIH